MTMWTAEDYDPLAPGLYVGKLLHIEPRESTNGEYRRWGWEILEGPYAGRKVYANPSTNFGLQAKPRQWVENVLGRELKAGEQIGTEDLVGGKHHLMVENVKRDGWRSRAKRGLPTRGRWAMMSRLEPRVAVDDVSVSGEGATR